MKKILLILLLLFIPTVYGVTIQRDESYVIRTVNSCTGFIEVFDTDDNDAIYNYKIKDCEREDNIWSCRCTTESFKIILLQNVTKNRQFNFIVRYYLEQEPGIDLPHEYSLREFPHEGIFVEVTPRIKKLPKLSSTGKRNILLFVLVLLVFIIGIIIMVARYIGKIKDDDDFGHISELDEEEQDKYLRNNTK